jgi:hypothetical protein
VITSASALARAALASATPLASAARASAIAFCSAMIASLRPASTGSGFMTVTWKLVKNSLPLVRAFDAPGSASRSAFWNSMRTFSSFQISRQVYFCATLISTCSAGWPMT